MAIINAVFALGNGVIRIIELGKKRQHVRDQQLLARAPGGGKHPIGVRQGKGNRFFDQDVLARLERGHGRRRMKVVRQANINQVDGRISE